MKKENLIDLEQDVEMYKRKLRELEPYIDEDEAMAVLYNQTIVDKAVLLNKIKKRNLKEDIFSKITNALKFKNRQKKICDYFMK